MASRMDKYNSNNNSTGANSIHSRLSKNENLYQQLYTNKVFTEFTNSNSDNIVDLSSVSDNVSKNRREQYQKSRILSNDDVVSNKQYDRNLYNKKEVFDDVREKNYNINDVLENAKKNRTEEDEIEKRKRLKSVEYSILSDLSHEKLNEYHENKQKKLSKAEEENLEELIHTITSNSLRKKIDDELLSELMPSEESEPIVSKELLDKIDDIENKTNEIKEEIEEENKIDDSFYTKSMDLSNEDFEFDEEEEDRSFLEDNKMSLVSKILVFLFIVIIIGIVCFVIYRFI